MNNLNKKNKKAFTLVELLVVIFIIALISSLVTVSLSQVRKSNRDVKRLADIAQLQIALENYRLVEGHYPESLNPGELLIGPQSGQIFMAIIPKNQAYFDYDCGFSDYSYNYDEDKNTYSINFCLEGNMDEYSLGNKCAHPSGVSDEFCFSCGGKFFDNRDQQSYSTTQIGDQCWFAENLRHDNNCSKVDDSDWGDIAWCGYYNKDSNYRDIYGLLYQWSAAMDGSDDEGAQGLCPDGWHIPTNNDWEAMISNLVIEYNCSGESDCGKHLKSTTTDWEESSFPGTNYSKFRALPAGYRYEAGDFKKISLNSYFWSSSPFTEPMFYGRDLRYDTDNIYKITGPSTLAFSIRCIQDQD